MENLDNFVIHNLKTQMVIHFVKLLDKQKGERNMVEIKGKLWMMLKKPNKLKDSHHVHVEMVHSK